MSKDIGDLYVQYYDEIYRYIYLFTLNRYDTEDILHNTFVKVMQGINSFKGKCDVKTWLLAIAHNECVNYFKKHKMEKVNIDNLEDVVLTIDDDIGKRLLYKEEVKKIINYIQIQKEPIKSLIILRLMDERPFEEIGKILNKSDVWCRVTFFRNKKKIMDILETDKDTI
ncbi:MAG: sigma-70 family RNA polymerase sigma factor [Lacrimispora sp.]|uniref:RNA polymerase sigma factor n=1 Tax=Lacrimispora sp. TaxID=2719234 RepID=UPI0039E42668